MSKRRPNTICGACIARALDIRHQQANRVTMALETISDFERRHGLCPDCGNAQKVIRRA